MLLKTDPVRHERSDTTVTCGRKFFPRCAVEDKHVNWHKKLHFPCEARQNCLPAPKIGGASIKIWMRGREGGPAAMRYEDESQLSVQLPPSADPPHCSESLFC